VEGIPGDHDAVGLDPERFDPEHDTAGVRSLAQSLLFGHWQGRAKLVKQRRFQ